MGYHRTMKKAFTVVWDTTISAIFGSFCGMGYHHYKKYTISPRPFNEGMAGDNKGAVSV